MEHSPQRHPWIEALAMAAIWLAAGWVALNFVHWIDPSYAKTPDIHWSNPRGWH